MLVGRLLIVTLVGAAVGIAALVAGEPAWVGLALYGAAGGVAMLVIGTGDRG